jgi:uncharacterized protein (UPF0332 family)
MRDKSREFYNEAKVLAGAKKYNGATSRLYYSLYHGITAVFEERGIKQSDLTNKVDQNNSGYWLHEVVRNNPSLAGVHRKDSRCVVEAWRLRVRADYEERQVHEQEVLELLPRIMAILIDLGVML